MQNKGQVTIFIVVSIIVVVATGLFFTLKGNILPGMGTDFGKNPAGFLKNCIEDQVEEGIILISSQGGSVNPVFYQPFQFTGEDSVNISYLCFNRNDFNPCKNQMPLLMKHMKNELKTYVSDTVDECIDELSEGLEKEGFAVETHYSRGDFDLDFDPKKVLININAKLNLMRTDTPTIYENFNVSIPSRIYELGNLAREIVNQESQYCHFSTDGYHVLHPQYQISRHITNSIKIYTLEYENSYEKFRFAVRGCSIPAGLW